MSGLPAVPLVEAGTFSVPETRPYTISQTLTGDTTVGKGEIFSVTIGTNGSGAAISNITPVQNDPHTKDDCKKNSWKNYGFKNQG